LGGALACCIDCILSCIEGLLEYFNKWGKCHFHSVPR
jgi:hypothetical protein